MMKRLTILFGFYLLLSYVITKPESPIDIERAKQQAQNTITVPINQVDDEDEQETDENQEIVLTTFAGLVQNFFNIATHPHDANTIGTNFAQMVSSIVHAAVQIIKNMPADLSQEEQDEYMATIERALKSSARTLKLAQKARVKPLSA